MTPAPSAEQQSSGTSFIVVAPGMILALMNSH
jgi:hypothetical protein